MVNRQTSLKTLPSYAEGNCCSASLPELKSRMLLSRWSSKGVSFKACMMPAVPNIPLRKSGGICIRESSPRSIVTPSGVVYNPRAVSKHWYSDNIPNFCLDAAVKRKNIRKFKNYTKVTRSPDDLLALKQKMPRKVHSFRLNHSGVAPIQFT